MGRMGKNYAIAVVPSKGGKSLIWDATCPDIFAPSYSTFASTEAGLVAAKAEENKKAKYHYLAVIYTFTPVAIQTTCSGAIGRQCLDFTCELGRRMEQVTGDTNPFAVSIAVSLHCCSARQVSHYPGIVWPPHLDVEDTY